MNRRHLIFTGILLVLVITLPLPAAELNLVPQPKTVTLKRGQFTFDNSVVIRVPANADSVVTFSGQLLQQELATELNLTPPIQTESGKRTIHLAICSQDDEMREFCRKNSLTLTEELGREGYVLLVKSKEIAVTGLTARGIFYGVQTLKQLIRGNAVDSRIPAVFIHDFPDMTIRGFQDDISRGPVPTMTFLKREIRRLAELKINYLTFYTEHVFQSEQYPEFAPAGGSLSVADIRELCNYARKYQIELIGNFQSFGHFGHILKHPRFAHLRETRGIISPAFAESYEFLDNILTEVAQAYDSPLFNINCDETHGLGRGPAKAMVEEIGIDSVYSRHINRIQEVLHAQNKRVMMWGDIALRHPGIIPQIAENTIMLSWNYGGLQNFEWAIVPFREAGFDVIVCPGVNSWRRLIPDFQRSKINIRNYIRDGLKHGALGVINTSWDDDGENLFSVNWHGIAFGAEQSWHSAEALVADYEARFSAAIYGDRQNRIGAAITTISPTHNLLSVEKLYNKKFWEPVFPGYGGSTEMRLTRWDAALQQAETARQFLSAAQASANSADLEYLDFSLRRVILMARMQLKAPEAAAAYERASLNQANPEFAGAGLRKAWKTVAGLHTELLHLKEQYRRLWLQENRVYWLDVILMRYDTLIQNLSDVLARLEDSMRDYEKGLNLISPAQVRLDISIGMDNYLSDWYLIGPFPTKPDHGKWQDATRQMVTVDYLEEIGGEKSLISDFTSPVYYAGKPYSWKHYQTERAALDLRLEFDEITFVTAYAALTLISDVAQTVKGFVGADDGIRVILNGEIVFEKGTYTGYHPGKRPISLQLNPGSNQLLVKVVQSMDDWGFSMNVPDRTVKKVGPARFEIMP